MLSQNTDHRALSVVLGYVERSQTLLGSEPEHSPGDPFFTSRPSMPGQIGREDGRASHEYDIPFNRALKKPGCYRLVQNDEMQGAQISRNESYIEYVAVTRGEAQRRRSRFSSAC